MFCLIERPSLPIMDLERFLVLLGEMVVVWAKGAWRVGGFGGRTDFRNEGKVFFFFIAVGVADFPPFLSYYLSDLIFLD